MICTHQAVVEKDYLRCNKKGKPKITYYGSKEWLANHTYEDVEKLNKTSHGKKEYVRVPCQKCRWCRLNNSKKWAERLVLETLYHENNWFLTLTYRPNDIPIMEEIKDQNGRTIFTQENDPDFGQGTLRKKDVQDFWKRLRKNLSLKNMKYFYCGEYGPTSQRPHYHAIVYDLPIPDLKEAKDEQGRIIQGYYNSKKH